MQGYTLPQLRAFLDGIAAVETDRARMRLITTRAAKATKKDFDRFLRGLS